jgi:hypothetical protein
VAVLAIETSTQEAIAAWDNATLRVEDAEGWAALAEREVLEQVSIVEAKTTAALAAAREDVEGFLRKIVLLEDELAAKHRAGRCPRGSTEGSSRSTPFYRPWALSCATSSSVPRE